MGLVIHKLVRIYLRFNECPNQNLQLLKQKLHFLPLVVHSYLQFQKMKEISCESGNQFLSQCYDDGSFNESRRLKMELFQDHLEKKNSNYLFSRADHSRKRTAMNALLKFY